MMYSDIKKKQLEARKAGNKERASVLTVVIGEIERKPRKSADQTPSDEVCVKVINDLITASDLILSKNPSDVIVRFEKTVLQELLPVMATKEQVIEVLSSGGFNTIKEALTLLERSFDAAFDRKAAVPIVQSMM